MRFRHVLTYDAPPGQVLAMLADARFREAVCEQQQVLRRTVRVTGHGTGMQVAIDRVQAAAGIPSFATRLVGEQIEVEQRESWVADDRAELTIGVPGKPARLTGTLTVAADGPGTRQTVEGDLRVSVPLVGGRLESFLADLLARALETESTVGARWLAAGRD